MAIPPAITFLASLSVGSFVVPVFHSNTAPVVAAFFLQLYTSMFAVLDIFPLAETEESKPISAPLIWLKNALSLRMRLFLNLLLTATLNKSLSLVLSTLLLM